MAEVEGHFHLDAEIGAFARVSQVPLEVLVLPSDGMARVSQVPLEVLVSPTDQMARVSQAVVEVLVKLPVVGSTKADATLKKTQTSSKTINAVIKATRTFGTRDVTYAYAGASAVIYSGHTKTAVEAVIPGCDLTLPVAPGDPVTIIWDVWQSHFRWAVDKKEIIRLRRDSISGLILWFTDPQHDDTDAGNSKTGHQWRFDGWYREAARTGRYVLTILPTKGNATLYSDSIYFSLQTPGVGSGMKIDAAIVIRRTRTFAVRARIRSSGTVVSASNIDAVITLPRSTSMGVDATLFLWGLGAFVTRAVVGRTATGSFTLGAQLVVTRTGSLTVSALIGIHVSGSMPVNAVVRRTAQVGVTAEAVVRSGVAASLTTNAIIGRVGGTTFTVDAWVKGSHFSVDAYLNVPSAGFFFVNALVFGSVLSSLTIDAALARHDSGSLTLDAAIIRRSFSVQGAFE